MKQPERAFRPLAETQPHLKEFADYLEISASESHRGAVLISTSFLEEQLRKILLAFFMADKASLKLFEGGSPPLGTFSARTIACYALGLIDQDEYHDLNQLRLIRNDFAHDMRTSFETRSVVDRCNNLHHKAHDYCHPDQKEVITPPAGQFKTAASSLMLNLTNRPHYVSQERRKPKAWQY